MDPANQEYSEYHRLAPVPAGESLELNYDFINERNLGDNQFIIELNPDSDQPEQFHFNNTGLIHFNVQGDKSNPLLDVTI